MVNSMSTNVMVLDVGEAVRFYSDVLGGEIAFVVDDKQQTSMDGTIPENAVFASVRLGTSEVMFQDRANLRR